MDKVNISETNLKAAEEHFIKGNELKNLKKYNEAIEEYKIAISLNPYLFNCHHKIGTLYFELNEMDNALEHYNKALKIKESVETLICRGNLYTKIRKYEEALSDYNKSLTKIKKEESGSFIYYCLGIVKTKMGKDKEAIDYFTKVIDSNDKNNLINALENRAIIYSKNENTYSKANADYENYVKLNSNISDQHYLKVKILRNMKNYEDCFEEYKILISLNPNNVEILLNVGILLEVMNNNEEALNYYNQALKLAPTFCMALIKKAFVLNKLKNKTDESTSSIQLLKFAKKCYKKDVDPCYSSYQKVHHEFIEESLEKIITIKYDLTKILGNLNKIHNENCNNLYEEIVKKVNDINPDTEKSSIEKLTLELNSLKLKINECQDFISKVSQETKELEALKSSLENLKLNDNIKFFKNAFLSEFSIAFVAAQSIASGRVQIDPNPSTIVSILNSGIELIPIIGSVVSTISSYVYDKVLTTKITASSDNLCKYCIDKSEGKALKIVGKVILENSNLIENYDFNKKTDDDFFTFLTKLYDSCVELKEKLESFIQINYAKDLPNHAKLGKELAQLVLSSIYNGDVYLHSKEEIEQEKFLQKKIIDFLSKNQISCDSQAISKTNQLESNFESQKNKSNNSNQRRSRQSTNSTSCCCIIF